MKEEKLGVESVGCAIRKENEYEMLSEEAHEK